MGIKKATYKDQVINHIYKEILKGRIKPGQQIKEAKLSEELDISRAPIREALKELISMGILEYKPRIGTFVLDPTSEDIRDTYVARGVLEGYAAASACGDFTCKDIDNLYRMCAQMGKLAESGKNIKLIDLGDRFHSRLTQKCKNTQIIRFAHTLSLKSHLMFHMFWTKLYSANEIEERHRIIVDAVKEKKANRIEQIIREHYAQTGAKIAQLKTQMGVN